MRRSGTANTRQLTDLMVSLLKVRGKIQNRKNAINPLSPPHRVYFMAHVPHCWEVDTMEETLSVTTYLQHLFLRWFELNCLVLPLFNCLRFSWVHLSYWKRWLWCFCALHECRVQAEGVASMSCVHFHGLLMTAMSRRLHWIGCASRMWIKALNFKASFSCQWYYNIWCNEE